MGTSEPTFDELLEQHSNGYVVLGLSERYGTYTIAVGPFDTKAEAEKARARLRQRWAYAERPHKVHTSVRILWKDH
jgi:cell division septation protein DedD